MNTYLSPKTAATLTALAALLSGCAWWMPAPGTVEINLATVNDFHGNLEPSKFSYSSVDGTRERSIVAGGIDTMGAALQAWRKQDPELLLVGAGDLIGGSPAISSMWADEPSIVAMNMLGLRASTVGNHEFNAGRVELLRQQKGGCASPRPDKACTFDKAFAGAKFSYLAANVIDMVTRKPMLPAYRIEQAHGVKLAFIGVVLRDVAEKSLASGVAGLEFIDEAEAVNRVLPELRKQGVGVFVVLIHQGGRTTDYFDQQDCSHLNGPIVGVVKRFDPAIRLVVSGHSHKGYLCRVDGRLVTQSEMGGHVMSRIKLTVDTASNSVREVSAHQEIMAPGAWPADPALDAYLATIRQRSAAALARPVAKLALRTVARERHEGDESALGDLVADAYLLAARPFGAQIAFMSNGGMRQDLEAGPDLVATTGQALMVLPFANDLVVMNMTGAQIAALLEQQWNGGRDITRGLLQVSEGFSYEYDARLPVGRRVVPGSVMLNKIPLEKDSQYRVVVNNFLAEGGEAYSAFTSGGSRAETGIRDIDALTSYLVKREQQGRPAGTASPLGRIKRLP